VWNDKKISAHHGIIPTANASVSIDSMSSDEFKVYDVIRRSYIAQFYPHYEYDKTDIEINASDELFKSNINIDVNLGWKIVINSSADKKTAVLPAFSVGQDLSVDSVEIEKKQTNPPARYTEGSLIASMEKAHLFIADNNLKKILKGNEGIGTEATRANIIETLIKRNFIKKSKKSIISTSVGKDLINIVPDALKDPGMTAMLESSLDKIASGELSLDDYLVWQVSWLEQLITTIKQNPLDIKTDAKSYPCPDCSSPMFLKKGKKAQFWGCSNYPTCETTAQNNGGKPLFERDMPDCPKCGKKLRKQKGKKGYFWGCKGYFDDPKCDFITNDDGGKPVLSNEK
jgi:DNA topoisomerase-3